MDAEEEAALKAHYGRGYLVKALVDMERNKMQAMAYQLVGVKGNGGETKPAADKAEKRRGKQKVRTQAQRDARAARKARKQQREAEEEKERIKTEQSLQYRTQSRLAEWFHRAAKALLSGISWETISNYPIPDFFRTLYDAVNDLREASVQVVATAMHSLAGLISRFWAYIRGFVFGQPEDGDAVDAAAEQSMEFSIESAAWFKATIGAFCDLLETIRNLFERAAQFLTCTFSALVDALYDAGKGEIESDALTTRDNIEAVAFTLFLGIADVVVPANFDVQAIMDYFMTVLPSFGAKQVDDLWVYLKDNAYVALIGATASSIGAIVVKIGSWLLLALQTLGYYLVLPCFWALSQSMSAVFEKLFAADLADAAIAIKEGTDANRAKALYHATITDDELTSPATSPERASAIREAADAQNSAFEFRANVVDPGKQGMVHYRYLATVMWAARHGKFEHPAFEKFAADYMTTAHVSRHVYTQATAHLLDVLAVTDATMAFSEAELIGNRFKVAADYSTATAKELNDMWDIATRRAKQYHATQTTSTTNVLNAHQRARAEFLMEGYLERKRLLEQIMWQRGIKLVQPAQDDAESTYANIRMCVRIVMGVVVPAVYILSYANVSVAERVAEAQNPHKGMSTSFPSHIHHNPPLHFEKLFLSDLQHNYGITGVDVTCRVAPADWWYHNTECVVVAPTIAVTTTEVLQRSTSQFVYYDVLGLQDKTYIDHWFGIPGRVVANKIYGDWRALCPAELSMVGFGNSLLAVPANWHNGKLYASLRSSAIGSILLGRYGIMLTTWQIMSEAITMFLFKLFNWLRGNYLTTEYKQQSSMIWQEYQSRFIPSLATGAAIVAIAMGAITASPYVVDAMVTSNYIWAAQEVSTWVGTALGGTGGLATAWNMARRYAGMKEDKQAKSKFESAAKIAMGMSAAASKDLLLLAYRGLDLMKGNAAKLLKKLFGKLTQAELELILDQLHENVTSVTHLESDPKLAPPTPTVAQKEESDRDFVAETLGMITRATDTLATGTEDDGGYDPTAVVATANAVFKFKAAYVAMAYAQFAATVNSAQRVPSLLLMIDNMVDAKGVPLVELKRRFIQEMGIIKGEKL